MVLLNNQSKNLFQDLNLDFSEKFVLPDCISVVDLIQLKRFSGNRNPLRCGKGQDLLDPSAVLLIVALIKAGQIVSGGENKIIVGSTVLQDKKYRLIDIGSSLPPIIHREESADCLIYQVRHHGLMFFVEFF